MGRTTLEPALSAGRWPGLNLDVFALVRERPIDGGAAEIVNSAR